MLVWCSEACNKGSRKNNFGIRAPIHPGPRRRSSVKYVNVFALLAPCGPGVSAPSVLRTYFCASPEACFGRRRASFVAVADPAPARGRETLRAQGPG